MAAAVAPVAALCVTTADCRHAYQLKKRPLPPLAEDAPLTPVEGEGDQGGVFFSASSGRSRFLSFREVPIPPAPSLAGKGGEEVYAKASRKP